MSRDPATEGRAALDEAPPRSPQDQTALDRPGSPPSPDAAAGVHTGAAPVRAQGVGSADAERQAMAELDARIRAYLAPGAHSRPPLQG
ncbi:MAG: hypothetical protein MUF76_09580 [Hydrogenophaga sp.]|jgi:hypothetical protein|nr:hypothetical protein [Hydrogenophaga sp.]